ncbi:MAG: FAD-dependent oxidoreductase [Clostridia bacterium]|nr:FAD-dependent oxidoreductase [Clostridia bacterium]
MNSLWQETNLPKFPKLTDDRKTDVLIIGGGMAGILIAYDLHQKGVNYILVEKNSICSENTQNTTAKITYQHGLIYSKIIKMYGIEFAEKYLKINSDALMRFNDLCKDIDCDFEEKRNYIYTRNDRSKLEKELEILQKLKTDCELCENVNIPIDTKGAIMTPNQAQFNPMKFIANISQSLNIYENTHVLEMIGNTAVTDCCKIYANKVICTTHFPFINKHGSYFFKLYQHRSYVLALENCPNVDGMYVDEEDTGFSFRNYDKYLLLGGGGGRTGKKNKSWSDLREFAKKNYPNYIEKFFWAAQDCMSLDGIPYIGQYSKNTPNFYVATGFNKWGMTSSMVASMIISDIILGKENDFEDVFNPSRSILKTQLIVNGFEAVANLLTPFKKTCPHMGCALKWNKAEKSWDCPCHGSRFTSKGKLLNNPANENMKP